MINLQKPTKPRVALLVDGENIGHGFAGKLIVESAALGDLLVKRVYGAAGRIPAWEQAPGFSFAHTGSGKNSADMRLCIDAMALFHAGRGDVFVLASSDGDFFHLATHLREAGATVVGIGEDKAPENFRKSCSRWIALGGGDAHERVLRLMRTHAKGLPIAQVNPSIKGQLNLSLAQVGAKSWRSYFRERPDLYVISGEGQATTISVRQLS